MKISIGSDHAGFELKTFLIEKLSEQGHDLTDCGVNSTDSVDYPDYAAKVCALINDNKAPLGIVICGTGIGISIAANKIKGIRAALCHNEFTARMARLHNNANVLALGEGVLGKKQALATAEAFLAQEYTGEERHQRRIDKMSDMETGNSGGSCC